MATRTYMAIADRAPGEEAWSIVFPGFPGVTSQAFDLRDVVRQASDALASMVEVMLEEGDVLLPAIEDGASPNFEPGDYDAPCALLVPVEVPGRAVPDW
jgi:predicted RNase H-like HicB family nuclease